MDVQTPAEGTGPSEEPKQRHPLAEFVGMFKGDPLIEDWKKSMKDYRKVRDNGGHVTPQLAVHPMSAHIAGHLAKWPSKEGMARILSSAGLKVVVGRYSVRVEDCSHFVFQDYGGDLGDPCIDADADSVAEMIREGDLVSDALARAKIKHRFEIYDDNDKLAGYLHYEWPLQEEGIP